MRLILRLGLTLGLGLAFATGPGTAHAAGQDDAPRYGSPRGEVIAGGAGIAAVGVAGIVGGVLLLRTQGKQMGSRPRAAIGAGVAVLGGILLPLGLSLAATGGQRPPLGTTVPRDNGQMIAGGLVSTLGGIALGGGAIVLARERGRLALPGGVAMLAAGNVLIGVGLPMWVRGSQRVTTELGAGPADATATATATRTPARRFVRPPHLAF